MSEPNIIKESSSDEEETIATINTGPSARPSSPETQCSVCLDELTNPSHTDSCLHSFCFECIRQWAHREDFCPLCHATFRYIYHSFDAMGVHKTYNIYRRSDESRSDNNSDGSYGTSFIGLDSISNDLFGPIFDPVRRIQVYANNWWAAPLQDTTGRIRDISPDFYRNHPFEMRRLHIFILRDIVAIRECLRLENQARPMVGETYMDMANSVMQSLLNCDIRQLHMIHNITIYLDVHALHFCHELYNFAISPFGILEYDTYFPHTYPLSATESPELLSTETIELNSENEEVQRPMIDIDVRCNTNDSDDVNHSFCCIPNSASEDRPSTSTGIQDSLNQPNNSNNDSDVVIIKHIIRPTKPLNSASVDQPSTSTGIRDSLNQPNNSNNDSDVVIIKHIIRPTKPLNSASVDQPSTSTGIRDSLNRPSYSFQSVDVGSSSYLSRIRRERWNSDSSSDDEDSMIAIRGSKTAHIKSQDIINKNKKKRKFIEKKEINTKIPPNNNRNCSNLESSSTSGETDTN